MQIPQGKRWIDAQAAPDDIQAVIDSYGFSPPMAKTLASRGLVSREDIARFLQPRISDLVDPFAIPGLKDACDIILDHIENGSVILVYGDYDVDGVTATALMVQVLSELGAQTVPFIPHPIEDGAGFELDPLMRCIRVHHPQLVVTVDCGTSSVQAVDAASRLGIDVVITDHHEPSDAGIAHHACALVNPKLGPVHGVQSGAPKAVRMLAGVGVAFKLCHGLVRSARARGVEEASHIDLTRYLDMVAMGTVADIVPLLDENRILVYHGLRLMNHTRSVGIKTLLKTADVAGEVDTYHIGFIIGPRINAAGRLGHADSALELLLTEDPKRAMDLAAKLSHDSLDRQQIEDRIVREACEDLDARFDPERDFGLVVAHENWHAGVIGIVASRLASRYNRPVVVIDKNPDGIGRASCRSIPGFDLLRHLTPCADILRRFGGHAMAAGLQIDLDRIPEFATRFNAVCAGTLRGADIQRQLTVDAWLEPKNINDHLYADQARLRPFGHSNPVPVWGLRNVVPVYPPRVSGGKHLKCFFNIHGIQREAIGFGMGDRRVPSGPLDIAFNLILNRYNGQTYLQLHLQDFRAAQPEVPSPPPPDPGPEE
ncbi:MAG: single-stranded-DNA-specific exonuclease RecJ [Kiritimatiellae bacterium]|nr:single-stranded-DNA-specific exonuclease RecJ [Kiritimatiellia bacterium]